MSLQTARADLLQALANPNLAILLVLAGILLLYAEFNRPGTIVLAAAGALAFMLGIYGLAQHSINPLALLCLLTGLALLLLDLPAKTRNLLATAATALLTLGLATLIPAPTRIHPAITILVAILFAAVTLTLGRIALRARRNKRLPAPHLQPSPLASTE